MRDFQLVINGVYFSLCFYGMIILSLEWCVERFHDVLPSLLESMKQRGATLESITVKDKEND